MFRLLSASPLLLGLWLISPSAAQEGTLLFTDDFSTMQAGWGQADQVQSVSGNRFLITAQANQIRVCQLQDKEFGDVDLRVKMTLVQGGKEASGGLAFWASDASNYYRLNVYSDGTLGVIRRTDGRNLVLAAPTLPATFKRGSGQSNELRVVTQGNLATIYVNGQSVASFHGFPPFDGSKIGLHGGSIDKPYSWAFSDLSVRRPPAGTPAAAREDLLILADNFAGPDLAWGPPDESSRATGNKLIMDVPPKKGMPRPYFGAAFGDADIRADVTLMKGDMAKQAGITFWGVDSANRYSAMVNTLGTFWVVRLINGEPTNHVLLDKVPALHTGSGQTNILRVVTTGNLATVYINGQQVTKFRGFPPATAARVGLTGYAGDEPSQWAFANFSVRHLPLPSAASDIPAGETPLLADDFHDLKASWSAESDKRRAAEGKLLISPVAEAGHTALHRAGPFSGDTDTRVNALLSAGGKNGCVGLIFWAEDEGNYYAAVIYPHGLFKVLQRVKGAFTRTSPVPLAMHHAVHTGIGQTNQLRVVTQGNTATVYINGQQAAAFTGTPPTPSASAMAKVAEKLRESGRKLPAAALEPRSKVGLYCESGAEPYTWAFSDLVVAKAAASSPLAPAPDEGLLFADDFHDLDPGWGEDGLVSVSDNKLIKVVAPKRIEGRLNRATLYTDADIRVQATVVKGSDDVQAGVVFWNNDWALVQPNGRAIIRRYEGDKKRQLYASPPGQPVGKTGLGQVNELRIVVRGKNATLFVNNRELVTIEGSPPEKGWWLGLGGAGTAGGMTCTFSDLQVRKVPENFAFSPALKASEEPPLTTSQEYLARALSRSKDGRDDEAMLDFDKAVELDPRNADAFAERGRIRVADDQRTHKSGGDFGKGDLDRAIEINPDHPKANYYRAVYHRIITKDQAATLADLERAQQVNPQLAEIYNLRGVVYSSRGDSQAALKEYDQAIELAPKDVTFLENRGRKWFDIGEYDKALLDLTTAIRVDPRSENSYYVRGLVRAKQADQVGAIDDYTKAIEIDATNFAFFAERARSRASLGDMVGALADISQAHKLDSTSDFVLQRRATLRVWQGDLSAALADCDQALKTAASQASAWVSRAYCRILLGDYAGALADTAQALKLNPYDRESYAISALARRFQGDLEGAIADLSRSLEIRSKTAIVYGDRGFCYLEKGDAAQALADFERWVVLARNIPTPLMSRAQANWQLRQTAAAEADFDQVLALWPDWEKKVKAEKESHQGFVAAKPSGVNREKRAAARLRGGDYYGALIDATQLLKQAPNDVPALMLHAQAIRELGYRQWAITDLSRVIQLAPQNTEAIGLRGDLLMESFQPAEALADFNRAIALEPQVALHYQRRGHVYAQQNERAKALADFDKAIELDPELASAYLGRGKLRVLANDLDKALDDFDRTVELAPSDADARLARGEGRHVKRYFEDAVADFSHAIASKPHFAEAFKARGLTRLAMNNPAEAKRDFAEAVLIRPSWEEELDKYLVSGPPVAKPAVAPSAKTDTASRPTSETTTPDPAQGQKLLVAARRARAGGNLGLAKKLFDDALAADPSLRATIERELMSLGRPNAPGRRAPSGAPSRRPSPSSTPQPKNP